MNNKIYFYHDMFLPNYKNIYNKRQLLVYGFLCRKKNNRDHVMLSLHDLMSGCCQSMYAAEQKIAFKRDISGLLEKRSSGYRISTPLDLMYVPFDESTKWKFKLNRVSDFLNRTPVSYEEIDKILQPKIHDKDALLYTYLIVKAFCEPEGGTLSYDWFKVNAEMDKTKVRNCLAYLCELGLLNKYACGSKNFTVYVPQIYATRVSLNFF